jgi:secondary thiamine-phosphate synthase enzyme
MKSKIDRISVSTRGKEDIQNVTAKINRSLEGANIETGICLVSVPHTTCGLTVNEDERGLIEDFKRLSAEMLEELRRHQDFQHDRIDSNASAHLTSSLLGFSISVPIRDGRLYLGTWQSVFLVECDGPRTRKLDITALGS